MISYSKEVQNALNEKRPVVALESTIIAHGMPYPKNVETALEIEQILRQKEVVPATIAVIEGKAKAGLSSDEIEILGKKGKDVLKLSSRDIPYALLKKIDGATTVAATMALAHLAGISIFATGGIGGVHREGEMTLDISADLFELSRTPVAVVSAGAKSILDLGLTLEQLETFCVPVIGYQTEYFPAFYCSKSPYRVPLSLETPQEVADFLEHKFSMSGQGGVLIANPIPKAAELDSNWMEEVIKKSLLTAKNQGINGKGTTPFLLKEIVSQTGGKSLEANIALVKNNAALAAEIANSY